jgi:hypothetical protein
VDNFTIVQYDDADEDGYNRYDLYFAGFGELLGQPEYSEEYFKDVQLNALGDGVTFFQTCIDNRFEGTDLSFTASKLEHDQQPTSDGADGNVDSSTSSQTDDNVDTNLIIGLTVAAVVVALCGIVLASRVMRGNEEESAALVGGKQDRPSLE